MSLFSKGIKMKTNSSCAKNIPKKPKTQETKRQTQDLLVQAKKNISLLLFLELCSFTVDLCNLGMTSAQLQMFQEVYRTLLL